MAPRKPKPEADKSLASKTASDKVVKKPKSTADKPLAARKGSDKVVKRPKRGYHTFKNGMLNVTPKGKEIEVTLANQQNPLLRLPAEIRNKIWAEVLGGKVFREVGCTNGLMHKLLPVGPETKNCLSFLQTCRQVYAETCFMPFSLNTFSVTSHNLRFSLMALRKIKPAQRNQITSLRLENHYYRCPMVAYDEQGSWRNFNDLYYAKLLPRLQSMQLLILYHSQGQDLGHGPKPTTKDMEDVYHRGVRKGEKLVVDVRVVDGGRAVWKECYRS